LRDTAAVTEVTGLDPSDIAKAVRALLLKETERVDDLR
jgi:hypothetical protein